MIEKQISNHILSFFNRSDNSIIFSNFNINRPLAAIAKERATEIAKTFIKGSMENPVEASIILDPSDIK